MSEVHVDVDGSAKGKEYISENEDVIKWFYNTLLHLNEYLGTTLKQMVYLINGTHS